MPHHLLLGVGFSRNWGGWVASEAFEYRLVCPEIRAESRLRVCPGRIWLGAASKTTSRDPRVALRYDPFSALRARSGRLGEGRGWRSLSSRVVAGSQSEVRGRIESGERHGYGTEFGAVAKM